MEFEFLDTTWRNPDAICPKEAKLQSNFMQVIGATETRDLGATYCLSDLFPKQMIDPQMLERFHKGHLLPNIIAARFKL